MGHLKFFTLPWLISVVQTLLELLGLLKAPKSADNSSVLMQAGES